MNGSGLRVSIFAAACVALGVVGCADDGTTTSSGGGSGGTGTTTGSMSTSDVSSSSTGTPPECMVASDCDTKLGPSPCGVWACTAGTCEASSPNCTDADHDGYGAGAMCACAGLDCDDADDTIFDTGARSCYSGPMGTDGVGTCQAGNQTCAQGVWTPCSGEITPSGEACNVQDDDCNGTLDDNLGMFTCGLGVCAKTVPACMAGLVGMCLPGAPASATDGPTCNGMDDDCDGVVDENCASCIPVSPTGNDGTADGSFLFPFQTVQAAINFAAANAGGPQLVCVAAGLVCGSTGTYQNTAGTTITMANGVSVVGNYEATTWTQCGNSTTILQPMTAAGVTFPATITKPTALSNFKVDRFPQATTTSAVTVDTGKGAILSQIVVTNTPAVTSSYGVNVINGGDVTITKSHIEGGAGTSETFGVRSVGSKVSITGNCLSLDANGRCDDGCNIANPAIWGRSSNNGTGTSHAVFLQDSAGSSIKQSTVCSFGTNTMSAIRIDGAMSANITIGENLIQAFGGSADSHGVWMEDCGGNAPWIVDNFNIQANGLNAMSRVDAVRAIGDCNPVIDSNLLITGGGEGNASNPTGVHCGANALGVASQCVVLSNKRIEGSHNGFPPIATGVRCEADGCNRVANNVITARGGQQGFGLWLENTTAVVQANRIQGGCSPTAVGVHAADAASRIENNMIFGYMASDCGPNSLPPAVTKGMEILTSAGLNELDIHSNDVDAGSAPGSAAPCTGYGIDLNVIGATPPAGPSGIFRNNIIRAGGCPTARYVFSESAANADPRIFENNDLDPFASPSALYVDENMSMMPPLTVMQVNALMDITVSGIISVDPMWVSPPMDLHLGAGSMCVDAGTATGAPATDFEGTMRGAMPDIGADEQ